MATVVLHPTTDFDQITVKHPKGYEVILVRVDGVLHAWRNRCPHLGIGLDYGDGRCLAEPGRLVCAMHGAMFNADDGFCTEGPCAGDSLERVDVRVEDGRIVAEA